MQPTDNIEKPTIPAAIAEDRGIKKRPRLDLRDKRTMCRVALVLSEDVINEDRIRAIRAKITPSMLIDELLRRAWTIPSRRKLNEEP